MRYNTLSSLRDAEDDGAFFAVHGSLRAGLGGMREEGRR